MRAQQEVEKITQRAKPAIRTAATIMICIISFIMGSMFGSSGRDAYDLMQPIIYIVGPLLIAILWCLVQFKIDRFCKQRVKYYFEEEVYKKRNSRVAKSGDTKLVLKNDEK
jgi:SNF family Na+-dependent transporter